MVSYSHQHLDKLFLLHEPDSAKVLMSLGSPATFPKVKDYGQWLCVPSFQTVCPYELKKQFPTEVLRAKQVP
jgi:hypothetical protein